MTGRSRGRQSSRFFILTFLFLICVSLKFIVLVGGFVAVVWVKNSLSGSGELFLEWVDLLPASGLACMWVVTSSCYTWRHGSQRYHIQMAHELVSAYATLVLLVNNLSSLAGLAGRSIKHITCRNSDSIDPNFSKVGAPGETKNAILHVFSTTLYLELE